MFEAIDHTTKADHALVELIRLDYADLASGPVMGDLLAHLEVAGRALRAAWAVYRTETEEK
jgi:hypothetical protein